MAKVCQGRAVASYGEAEKALPKGGAPFCKGLLLEVNWQVEHSQGVVFTRKKLRLHCRKVLPDWHHSPSTEPTQNGITASCRSSPILLH